MVLSPSVASYQPSILIVDDHLDNLELLETILVNHKYKVLTSKGTPRNKISKLIYKKEIYRQTN